MFEYKFINIPFDSGAASKNGDALIWCRKSIAEKALEGWRLKQVITAPNENSSSHQPWCYEVIMEREL